MIIESFDKDNEDIYFINGIISMCYRIPYDHFKLKNVLVPGTETGLSQLMSSAQMRIFSLKTFVYKIICY